MGWILDREGRLPSAGQLVHEYRSNFHLGSIPTWITASLASNNVGATYPIVNDPSTAIPGCVLTTAAPLNSRATLIGPGINTALARRITVDVFTEGGAISNTSGDGRTVSLAIGNLPNTANTEASSVTEAQNEASGMPLTVSHGSTTPLISQRSGRQWRSNLTDPQPFVQHTLVLDLAQRMTILLNHDQPVFGINIPAAQMPTGILFPYVRVLATEAIPVTLKVNRFDVTVEY